MTKKVALSIGIDNYDGNNKLPGSVASARGMAKLLHQLDRFDKIFELYDSGATKKGIFDSINQAFQLIDNGQIGNVLVINYNGHGFKVNGINCLMPIDSIDNSGNAVSSNVISMYEWWGLLNKRPSHCHFFENLDCCYSASFKGGEVFVQSPIINQPISLQSINALAFNKSNYVGFYPCGDNQESVQMLFGNQWYSLMTYQLLIAMQRPLLIAKPHRYIDYFAFIKTRSMVAWRDATPQINGDILQQKSWLT